jgi:hypothetical protein
VLLLQWVRSGAEVEKRPEVGAPARPAQALELQRRTARRFWNEVLQLTGTLVVTMDQCIGSASSMFHTALC